MVKANVINRWLRATVQHRAPGGMDQYGQPSWSSPTAIRARVVHQAKRTRTPAGEEITSTTQVQTLATVNVGDELTIDGVPRLVQSVQRADGVHGGATINEAML